IELRAPRDLHASHRRALGHRLEDPEAVADVRQRHGHRGAEVDADLLRERDRFLGTFGASRHGYPATSASVASTTVLLPISLPFMPSRWIRLAGWKRCRSRFDSTLLASPRTDWYLQQSPRD